MGVNILPDVGPVKAALEDRVPAARAVSTCSTTGRHRAAWAWLGGSHWYARERGTTSVPCRAGLWATLGCPRGWFSRVFPGDAIVVQGLTGRRGH